MKKNLFLNLSISLLLFASCGGSDEVEVGNKTTMSVEPVFDAGKVMKGEKIDATFTIKNTGSYPLVIGEVRGSCTCTVVDKPEDPIKPGDEYVIRASVDTDKTGNGAISKSITILANTDPSLTNVIVRGMVIEK